MVVSPLVSLFYVGKLQNNFELRKLWQKVVVILSCKSVKLDCRALKKAEFSSYDFAFSSGYLCMKTTWFAFPVCTTLYDGGRLMVARPS